jgi:hypothetical protein
MTNSIDTRDVSDAFTADEGKDALGITITRRSGKGEEGSNYDAKPPGMPTELRLLFRREFRNLVRDTTALGARFGITIFLGVLIGTIFLDVGNSDPAVQVNINSHFGALVIVMLTAMFGTAQPALLAFPEERPVFLREYSTNHYSVISYFLARLSNEAIITGAQIFVNVSYLTLGFDLNIRQVQHCLTFFSPHYFSVLDYLLHDWIPNNFWTLLRHCLLSRHGQHCARGVARLRC